MALFFFWKKKVNLEKNLKNVNVIVEKLQFNIIHVNFQIQKASIITISLI